MNVSAALPFSSGSAAIYPVAGLDKPLLHIQDQLLIWKFSAVKCIKLN